jgi:hypothetical protein
MSRLLRKRRLHAQHEVDYTFAHFRRHRVFCVPRRTSSDHVGCGHSPPSNSIETYPTYNAPVASTFRTFAQ